MTSGAAAALRCGVITLWLCLTLAERGAAAAEVTARVEPASNYHALYLEEDGRVLPGVLDTLTADIRAETQGRPSDIILLLHGYNTSYTLGRRQYREIAGSLRKATQEQGWRPVIVGVHWPSYPGPPARWLPQMLGYRFLSAAGFPNAVPNPYLEKVAMASKAGRTGLRSTLFRLKDAFPGWALHVFAHSMGSELVVRALDPEGQEEGVAVEQPGRRLTLDLVVLAGADLDRDTFVPSNSDGASEALDRAAVWWITVPRRNTADAALELRRAAGRHDAMGNVGLTLTQAQFDGLMGRRGLVIDNRSVPITHDITDYYSPERVRSITASLRHLQGRATSAAKESLLATLDRILKADPARLPAPDNIRGASARLYVRWRRESPRQDYGPVRILASPAIPAAMSRRPAFAR